MTEIASSSSFLAGADLVPPGQRDTKPRSGSVPFVPFGSLVSEAAQNKTRPARMQDEPPAPKTPTFEEETRATERREAREARDTQEPPARERAGRAAEDATRPQTKANRRAEGRREDGSAASRADEVAEDDTQSEEISSAEAKAEKQDGKACDGMAEPATEETPAEGTAGAESEGEVATVAVVAEAVVDPALTIPVAETDVDAAALLAVNAAAGTSAAPEGEGEADATAPGLARAALLVADTPAAAVLTALASGEKPKDAAAATDPQTSDLPLPEAGASTGKGSADLIALMQSKTGDTVVKTATQAPQPTPAGEIAKVNFADWINEFALAQGATHRSGDLVGSLDRALAAVPTAHSGQDALRPTPLQMLPIEIGMQAVRGVKTFQIRLDPAELGRVEVKLEFKEDGEVKASLVVDRVETLAMLKRDAPTLQQAFEQAGLRQSPDGLSFQLRGEQQGREGQRENEGQGKAAWADDSEDAGAQRPAEFVMRRVMIPNSSLDLVI